MCTPGNIFRILDGSIIYRIWLPVSLHTLFAALIVTLYWVYRISLSSAGGVDVRSGDPEYCSASNEYRPRPPPRLPQLSPVRISVSNPSNNFHLFLRCQNLRQPNDRRNPALNPSNLPRLPVPPARKNNSDKTSPRFRLRGAPLPARAVRRVSGP
jgi:hypothetical protein